MTNRNYQLTRRDFLKTAGIAGVALGVVMSGWTLSGCRRTSTSTSAPGEPAPRLDGSTLGQFVDPLPGLHTIIAGQNQLELRMKEFRYNMLPTGFKPQSGAYGGTWVWGYLEPGQSVIPSYIGPVIVATRGIPTQVKFVNDLGNTADTNLLAYKNSTDQTLHWADPLNGGVNEASHNEISGEPPLSPWDRNYAGAIPAIPHLHGGEVPPVMDGGPEQWFTSDGNHHGFSYYDGPGGGGNSCVFRYPNSQQAAPIWFHDHTLGATRLNVYCGLAGAYLITDPALNLPPNFPGPADIVPLVIQDRMFDVNGQLYFPSDPNPNPEHPFWVPEFAGDTIVVNGKVWPYMDVEARRYRFFFLNGSNARTYHFSLSDNSSMWIISNDGGYLDKPVSVKDFLMQPGERYEVIIDFSSAGGKNIILKNDANTPYPDGDTPPPATLGRIMQFRVSSNRASDASYDPASGMSILAGAQKIVRLSDPETGTLAAGVTVAKTRALTLNEIMTRPVEIDGREYEGGPTEVLVNNTPWEGKRMNAMTGEMEPVPGSVFDTFANYVTETPNEGDTEVWEVINLTADAHPIHLHLAQFQIMNRQNFDVENYLKAYSALFPESMQIDPETGEPHEGGMFIGGYGPPLSYAPSDATGGKYGGNPQVKPFLLDDPQPPAAYESGWKDVVVSHAGMVTRIVVRWAPTDKPLDDPAMRYPFDPNAGGRGYVWHCHIIDHEDNEMMRPNIILPDASAARTYVMGTDY